MINKHGLKRYIPAEIRREIRQNSGFGCVICGLGIIQYEHVDPEFNDAKEHDPVRMTLLCPRCHNKVTTGYLDKEIVKEAMKNPKCLSKGFSNEFFHIGKGYPKIEFAGSIISNCPIPIQIKDEPLFVIEPGENGSPFLLSANFYDTKGNLSLEIKQNEWNAYISNWDIEVIGGAITIREKEGKINLKLSAKYPDILEVSDLDMYKKDVRIKANLKDFSVYHGEVLKCTFSSCFADNCAIGFKM
ncbi:MAG: hypothetical protein U9R42_00545 [Bacteroidota bacterium]|nr:hypothetical protein [Bacteroidota bacterium]